MTQTSNPVFLLTWVLAAISLVGTILNVKQRRVCFVLWFSANLAWVWIDWVHGVPAQAILMGIYAVLAVWGWFSWKK